jgi:diguanylate cyclase (GGDEF)-like protein
MASRRLESGKGHQVSGRRRLRLSANSLLVALLVLIGVFTRKNQALAASTLPVLTTVRQAHGLNQEQAALGYPVRLRVVVTYYDPPNDQRRVSFFVADATGGIFVRPPQRAMPEMRAGTPIEVTGVTAPGDFAPIIVHATLHILRAPRRLPRASRVTLPHMQSGADDANWMEVEGMVHSVEADAKDFVLGLSTSDGALTATTPAQGGEDYAALIDAKVLIRGVAAALFNQKREMVGIRLLFPGLAAVKVEEPPPTDPFSLPILSVGRLMQYSQTSVLRHRVHLRGRATLHWPGRMLCVQQGRDGLCVRTLDQTTLDDGQLVDVAGFPAIDNYQPTLSDSILRRAGTSIPIVARRIGASEAFAGGDSSQLVQIEASVVSTSRTMDATTLLLSSGGFVFPAILPADMSDPEIDLWLRRLEGCKVTIKGVFSGNVDALKTRREGAIQLESLRILLQSPADVVVLQRPSWWTSQRTLTVLGIVLSLTLAVLVWVALLRRRVKQQTLLIRRSEERFRHLAEHDSLTGLVSRSLLHERLNQELESARRKQTPLALLIMDLDRFKQVNDSLGHAAGDEILRVTAQRIRGAVRASDTVARMSGDEFIVLLPGVRGRREAGKIAAQVVTSVAAPVNFRGREVPISVSVGISTYPDGGEDATALLQNGDVAMYQAKAIGRNCYRFFTPDMSRAPGDQLDFAVALNRALVNEEFEVYFQPLIDLRTGEVDGLEALLRWRTERWGMVAPGDFIPLAEENGLIGAIGEWVLRESCRQVGQMESRLGRRLLLSVNISPRQMEHGDLVRTVREVLHDSHRAARDLELEITERILVGNSGKTKETFHQLRELGVRLAIDDFGTGFANLSYITQFEIDRLKIDRSFIQQCLIERNSATVTRVIIAMAHKLEVSVVAEGVETAEQYRFLQEAGCDLAQGYYLSEPIMASDLEEMLLTRSPWGHKPQAPSPGNHSVGASAAKGEEPVSVSANIRVNSDTLEELQR